MRSAPARAVAPGSPARPRAVVALEAAAVLACAALLAPLLARVALLPPRPTALLEVLAGVAAGYVAADVVSGLVHWFCDRFLDEDTPAVGSLVIVPFREHHRDPEAMTRHGFLELTGNSGLALAPGLALAGLRPLPLVADAALAALALALLATNVVHGWAHAARVPPLVARLQAWGLILRPAAHAAHHAPGHRGAYCVTSGWANRWLDRPGVLLRLERGLERLGVPRAHA